MKKVSLQKILVTFGVAALGITFTTNCAQAGQWVLDDIQASGEYKAKNSYYYAWQGHYSYDTEDFKWKQETFSCKQNPIEGRDMYKGWGVDNTMGRFNLYVKRKYGSYNTGGPHPAATTKVSFTVAPKFVYVRDRVNHSAENNWQGVPDPNDKPGTFFYLEKGGLLATRSKGGNFDEATTRIKDITTLSALQSPFPGSPLKVIESYDTPQLLSEVYETFKITKKKPDDDSGVIMGDERTFTINVSSSAISFNDLYAQVNIDLRANYQVEMLSFMLTSRRKQDTAGGFDSTSTISAGGVDDNIHKSDVRLEVRRVETDIHNRNKAVPDFPSSELPDLKVGNVKLKPPTVDRLDSVTDSDGRMVVGLVTSGNYANRDSDVPYVYFEGLSNTSFGAAPTTNINHSWGTATLGMGPELTEPWEKEFHTTMGDYKRKVWAKVLFSDPPPIPLGAHTMKFVPTYVRVRVQDKNTHEIQTKIFSTRQPDFANGDSHFPNDVYVIKDHIYDDVKEYINFSGTTEVTSGVYTDEITVVKSPDFIVDHYDAKLIDTKVYEKR